MRYFNVIQNREPKSMLIDKRIADISELENMAKEITKDQAKKKPQWGSGNISVDETGKWEWVKTNHDSSG